MPGEADGLRERKKQRTREEISNVATQLFAEHGFEEVTLAQIAAAAEVSIKTIFNHFGSKEDLYFDRVGEILDALVTTVVERPPGTTVLGALHALLAENFVPFRELGWAPLDDAAGYARFRAFMATQDRSPALRARRLTLGEQLAVELSPVLARELDADPDAPALRALSAMLSAAMALRDAVLRAAMAAEAPPAEVRRRVVAVVDESFTRLEIAFRDLDRPRRRGRRAR